MVMLDEAFTRIDDEGRRGIMGLISKFDLDIMLTSPEYWGCCAEVPELDIYVLAPRDASAPGVVARHFHWDGERRALVDDPPRRHGNGIVELTPQLDDGQLDLDGPTAGRRLVTAQTETYLGERSFTRLWQAARIAFERNGGLGGQALVTDLSAEEATALNGLLRRRQPLRAGADLRLPLVHLDETLREFACPLEDVLVQFGGRLGEPARPARSRRGTGGGSLARSHRVGASIAGVACSRG